MEKRNNEIITNDPAEIVARKPSDLIQKSRYVLTPVQGRIVLLALSAFRKGDKDDVVYSLDLRNFLRACNGDDASLDSMTRLKRSIQSLQAKSWWYTTNDGTERLCQWFGCVELLRDKSIARFTLHPFLTDLMNNGGKYYTQLDAIYLLPMHSGYGQRLYELLKSYALNNRQWTFAIDDLRQRLDCRNKYDAWRDFKRFALMPGLADINAFSDICVTMEPIREGHKYGKVRFLFTKKSREIINETRVSNGYLLANTTLEDSIDAAIKATDDDPATLTTLSPADDQKRKEGTKKRQSRAQPPAPQPEQKESWLMRLFGRK